MDEEADLDDFENKYLDKTLIKQKEENLEQNRLIKLYLTNGK